MTICWGVFCVVDGALELVGVRKTEAGAWALAARKLGRKLYGGTRVDHKTIEIRGNDNALQAQIVRDWFAPGDRKLYGEIQREGIPTRRGQ